MHKRQFYLVREVAGLLKVGEVTVRHWIRDRELRAIDIGREWRIASDDLEDFLERHSNRPAARPTAPLTRERATDE